MAPGARPDGRRREPSSGNCEAPAPGSPSALRPRPRSRPSARICRLGVSFGEDILAHSPYWHRPNRSARSVSDGGGAIQAVPVLHGQVLAREACASANLPIGQSPTQEVDVTSSVARQGIGRDGGWTRAVTGRGAGFKGPGLPGRRHLRACFKGKMFHLERVGTSRLNFGPLRRTIAWA